MAKLAKTIKDIIVTQFWSNRARTRVAVGPIKLLVLRQDVAQAWDWFGPSDCQETLVEYMA